MESKRALALALNGPELERGTKPVQVRGTLNSGLRISFIIKYYMTLTVLSLVYKTHYP